MASRPPHHNMYAHPQQIPPQQIRQQHVPPQPHVSRPSRPSRPELVTSQHMVSARQIQSHQAVQQHQKPTVPQHAQQYMDVHQMNQDAQHQQLQQQYHGARMQNPQAQLTQMPSSNSPYPLATSKTDLAQRYQQPVQAAHHTQQKGQKVGIQHGRVAAVHQQQIPAQQAHQGQQAMSQQMHMARRSTAASNVNHISVMRGANIHNGQLYPAGLGLPASAMQSANIQYPPSYTSTGLFDPLNLNPAGIPLSSVGVSQPATNQAVNVARDLERQGQNSQLPQGVARSGVHVHERNGVTAQDIQSYADQGQAQLLHRPGGHSTPQDFQDQAVSQHHVQTGLYQPVEQQQNTPHLILNQGTGLAPPQGSVVVHTQPSQIPQASAAADDQLNQQVYQNSAQNQLPGVAAGDGQQVGDLSSRKAAVPTTQQELLQWHGSGPNSRAVNNGLSQQPNGVATGTVSGPIITQSHLLDMGVPNARHPRQNSIAQISQLTGIQATSDQRNGSQKRQLPASGDEGSPRKRRQLGPGTPSPLESSRTYPCSGCGQDFARKRDRDNHVRTVHERSFRCSKCESRFKTKSDANRHVRIVHDRVRPYQCPSCPSMFSERNKLRRHKETVHEKRRPFVCPVCSSRFGELGNLRQHTGSLHPEYQSGSGSNPGRSRVNHQVQS
ncbi:unnamed protein product [Chondrus crispus]|uniref:C2H2-type domain-containing protein n=1 Tax=Chondrus crispus TaxID=2769 RepID=R7Q4W2_CHOCR|nr:unnamed protein product [Chondrus crispus]CDF32411.1 unnamed protein product [Chondrus crispus]|eukprot:XP_005712076.1 unnamed protein product [Chondrus crispus]